MGKRQWVVLAVVVVLGALGVVLARGFRAELPAGGGTRELVYAGLGDPQEVEIIRGVLREFERENPRYRVRFVHIPGSPYWTKLKIMFAGGVAPDVLYIGGGYLQELAAGGQLMDVDDAAGRYEPKLNWGEFLPEGVEAFKHGGRTYGIPRDVAPIAVFYNRDLFDAGGIPYPKPGWTRDEFLDVAKTLTRPDSRQFGVHVRTWSAEFLPAIWSEGGRVLSDDKSRVAVDSPEAIDGLRFFRDLIFKYRVAPEAAQQETNFPLFNAGRCGMSLGGYWSVAERRTLQFRWGVVPLPRARYGTTVLFGAGYAIAKNTRDPEGAWRLATFMTSPKVQRDVALLGLAVPARLNALTPEDLQRDPILASFVDCLKDCRPPPFVPRWKEVEDQLNRHVQRLLMNIDSPEETTKGIARDVQPLLSGQQGGEK